jgi:hypothetical protein
MTPEDIVLTGGNIIDENTIMHIPNKYDIFIDILKKYICC